MVVLGCLARIGGSAWVLGANTLCRPELARKTAPWIVISPLKTSTSYSPTRVMKASTFSLISTHSSSTLLISVPSVLDSCTTGARRGGVKPSSPSVNAIPGVVAPLRVPSQGSVPTAAAKSVASGVEARPAVDVWPDCRASFAAAKALN